MHHKLNRCARLTRCLPLCAVVGLSAIALSACGGGGGGGAPGTGAPGLANEIVPEPGDVVVALSWDANRQPVEGYRIYYGTDADSVDNEIGEVQVGSGEFDPAAPTAYISASYDLGLPNPDGHTACFSVQAYNETGASELSVPVCQTL